MNILTPSAAKEMKQRFPDIVSLNVSMASLSYWRIGGHVAVLVTPRTEEDLAQIQDWIELYQLPSMVIGHTTNLLFADEGVDAVVIQVGKHFSGIQIQGQEIIAKAGVYIPCLARRAMQFGLTGLEHTIGIPGTLGGLVCMNGGSQRKSIGEAVIYVDAVDCKGRKVRYTADECGFAYRTSIFQELNLIITSVGLRLEFAKDKTKVHSNMLSILQERSKKFPRKFPNCGSVFVSNPAMYEKFGSPGKIIEDCGLKGLEHGGAQISPLHANFIINKNSAAAADVLYLIRFAHDKVLDKTGHSMAVEVKFVDVAGNVFQIVMD